MKHIHTHTLIPYCLLYWHLIQFIHSVISLIWKEQLEWTNFPSVINKVFLIQALIQKWLNLKNYKVSRQIFGTTDSENWISTNYRTCLLIRAWQVGGITNVILNMCSHMSWQFPCEIVCVSTSNRNQFCGILAKHTNYSRQSLMS